MKKYIIGCSGFHYKHWRGSFYPQDLPVKHWFDYYCKHFNTLELNVTFYRFPRLSTLRDWYERAPEDFIFSVKVPRAITHFKKLNNTTQMLGDFYALIREGLQEKTGCVLFQFPPNFSCNEMHVQRLIDCVDPSFQNVAEFRHTSWWNAEVIQRLGQHQIAFCGMSYPEFPQDPIGNTRHLYYRFHGQSELYASDYADDELRKMIAESTSLPGVEECYFYFNNDIRGHAVTNAMRMITYIKHEALS